MQPIDTSRYAELFRSESREHLAAMEASLALLRTDNHAQQLECIADLFRSTHTIKGMAAAMGYSSVEQIAHALESVLDRVRSDERQINEELLRSLTDGADALASAVDNAVDGSENESNEAVVSTAFAVARSDNITEGAKEQSSRDKADSTVRIDLQRLDNLLNIAGELVLARDRLKQAVEAIAASSATDELKRAVHDAGALISAVQDEVLSLRMVPAHQLFDRFPRLVRELSRDIGKEVHFATEGRDIEVDRSLLDALADPVMHLLRNAVDHGIEEESVRLERGKSPRGSLMLRAVRDRNAVVIQVEDDGKGIDRNAVLERARSRGLVDASTNALSDENLLHLIAHPGLSTAQAVTSISGRGVGIDVVVHSVRALGGTLELETVPGSGTRFTLRLPAALAIARALLVTAGGESFAFSASHVMEVHAFEDIDRVSDSDVRIRDDVLPLIELQRKFELPSSSADDRHVVVVESGSGRRAVLVDAITGHQDIVVKRFHSVPEAQPWFSGATLLGDGSPALIVDLRSLA